MKTYEYSAATTKAKSVRGVASAASPLALDRDLELSGLTLTSYREVADESDVRPRVIGRDSLARLCSQLATLTGSGVPLVEGLHGLADRTDDPALGEVVLDLVRRLEQGDSFSDALAEHPRSFPEYVRAAVRAGESAGALPIALERATRQVEWSIAMRSTAFQALVYPCALMAAIAVLVGILLVHVLPKITALVPGGTADLPAETRAVLAVSDFLQADWPVLVALAAALVGGFVLTRSSEAGRRTLDGLLLGVPVLGSLAKAIATSRFAATAATLHSSGCDVFTVLSVSGSASGNAALGAAFERAGERVRAGSALGDALGDEPLVDPLLVQAVGVGEASGVLGQGLERLARHYDEEVPRIVKRTLAMLEPALLGGAGLVVAVVLLAATLPVLDVYDRLG